MSDPRLPSPSSFGSDALDGGMIAMDAALGRDAAGDSVESYFECITTCSLDDGACITECVEQLRMHH